MREAPHLRAADGGKVSGRRRRWLAHVFVVIFGAGAGAGPVQARQVPFAAPEEVSGSVDGAQTIHAVDVDGDGDLDLLSGALYGHTVAWHENDGSGGAWTKHTITTSAHFVYSVHAADVDGDGDIDVLSASQHDDTIAWYENRGGQFALPTEDVAQKVVGSSEVHDLLAVQVVHRGRAGDTDVELASLELLLTDGAGRPLTTVEANDLIQELRVYLDDGSGAFEESPD